MLLHPNQGFISLTNFYQHMLFAFSRISLYTSFLESHWRVLLRKLPTSAMYAVWCNETSFACELLTWGTTTIWCHSYSATCKVFFLIYYLFKFCALFESITIKILFSRIFGTFQIVKHNKSNGSGLEQFNVNMEFKK